MSNSLKNLFTILLVSVMSALVALPAQGQGAIEWRTAGSAKASSTASAPTELFARGDARHVVVQFAQTPDAKERAALQEGGITLQSYLGSNAYFALVEPLKSAAKSASGVVLAQEIDPVWKTHPMIAAKNFPEYALIPEASQEPATTNSKSSKQQTTFLAVYVIFHADIDAATAGATLVEQFGGEVRDYMVSINGLVAWLPLSAVDGFIAQDEVQWVEPPLPPLGETNNSNRTITQVGTLNTAPYNLTGSGITAMVYDGGKADQSHPDFGARLTTRDTSATSDHATHVSGTIGGNGTNSAAFGGTPNQWRGMAPGVRIESYGFEYDGTGEFLYTNPGDLEADYDQAINTYGVMIANNSIGTNVAPNGFPCEWEGDYGATSQLIDEIVRGSLGAPMRIIWANGNERGSGRCGNAYNTTAPPAGAKNHIAVGALNSNNDSVTSFTSWGPTDDGRMKPDVSGPGCQSNEDGGVTSTAVGGGYSVKCGTSMACPAVTGIGALILEDFMAQFPDEPLPRNSTLKVLLAQNAQDIGNTGPDYQTGFGSVRAKATIDFMRTGRFFESEIEQSETAYFSVAVPAGSPTLKVTIAWDDAPGALNTTPTLVNDLDIVCVAPNGTTIHFPWTLDPASPAAAAVRTQADRRNNIEQVLVDNPTPGAWQIRVIGFNVPDGPQVFSLAANGSISDCTSAGTVALDSEFYACTDSAVIVVTDCDLNLNAAAADTVIANVATTSESAGEPVVLTETDVNSGVFTGSIALSAANTAGQLQVAPGDQVTARYNDANNGTGSPATVTDTARVDCDPPEIIAMTLGEITSTSATGQLTVDEPVRVEIFYGTVCGAPNVSIGTDTLAASHSIPFYGLAPGTTYYATIEMSDEAGNLVSDDNGGSCFSFTTETPSDYFTEQFTTNFDLDNTTLTFTPNGEEDFYQVCREPATAFPTNPAAGTAMNLSDDTSFTVTLPGSPVSLYGTTYSSVRVGSNGYLTFTASDTEYLESLGRHFDRPRISALFDDLNPTGSSSSETYQILADRLVVSFVNVGEFSTAGSNNFQYELFFDGRIRITWLNVSATDGLAGLSRGTGTPANFTPSDLSAFGCDAVIRGAVTLSGAGLGGVSLSGFPDSVSSGPDGSYEALVPRGWSGVVTPMLADYQFTPAQRVYNNVSGNLHGEGYEAYQELCDIQILSVTHAPDSVAEGGEVAVGVVAENVGSGSPLQYQWSANLGSFADANAASTTWSAPVGCVPEPHEVEITVTISCAGSTESADFTLIVLPSDYDSDGLDTCEEDVYGTDPYNPDSDNDGVRDGTETGSGTDPLDDASVPSDVYVAKSIGSDITGVGTQTSPWYSIAHAIAMVEGNGNNVISIHVATGRYEHQTNPLGPIRLDSYEKLLGGYDPVSWTRDIYANYSSILALSAASNVIVLDGIVGAELDGFIIRGASSTSSAVPDSAGILCVNIDETTTIRNCTIEGNNTNSGGSGGLLLKDSSPVIEDCAIFRNYSFGSGGGIGILGDSSPLITRCAIIANGSWNGGGGIYVGPGAEATITNSLIENNRTQGYTGGAIYLNNGGATISNCTIAYNSVDATHGTAVGVLTSQPTSISNCVFFENDRYALSYPSPPTAGYSLLNNLFHGNVVADVYIPGGAPATVTGATGINSTLSGAMANVDGDPNYQMPGGVLSTAGLDASQRFGVLTDPNAEFVPGSLKGKVIAKGSGRTIAMILDNTETTILVENWMSSFFLAGDSYWIIDYHLQPGSAAIDMGLDTSAPEDGGVTVDFDGVARGFDGDGDGAATADGSDYDIGAYESDTPLDSITVLAPNGGETFTRGTPVEIRWSSAGNVGTSVKILIRRGTYVGTLFGGTPNDGVHTWNIPSNYAIASGYTIEVVSVANPAISDASNAGFSIAASTSPTGTLTVTAPNGGESFLQGATVPITWTSTGSPGANVDILARRGAATVTVASATPNDGAFNWIVPTDQAPGTDYVIEVRSTTTPTITDSSNAPFSIIVPPRLTVTAPNGGESYLQGATVPVTWTSTGTPGTNVDILARRGAASYTVASSTPNDGAFNWIVPTDQTPGTDYVIEVRSSTSPAITDSSNAPFTISAPPTLLLAAPNGGESYLPGATVPITWSSTGAVGSIVQLLAHSAGQTFSIDAGTTNDGAYDWVIPANQAPGTDYTIEVRSLSNPAISDTSNAPFTIQASAPANSITVLSPNGGEYLLRGTTVQFRWSTTGNVGTSVKIVLRRGTYSGTLFGGTPNDGVQNWSIPTNYPAASDYTVEISSTSNPAIRDASDGPFSVTDTAPATSIAVTSPNGGESYVQGGTLPITWTSTGAVGTIVQIFAHGAGQTFSIDAAATNDGAFDWAIPADQPVGTNYTIEVRSLSTPAITDSSNSPFTINAAPPASTITVTAPNGGESYVQGGTVPITWTSTGAPGTIVQIFTHGGGQTFTIDAAATNDGAYDWAVPTGQPAGTDYTIEVRSLATPAITDRSNSPFTITATPPANSITVISPNGGETFNRGSVVELRWSTTGVVGSSLKVVIRRGAFVGTLFGGTPNDGVHTWTIPATYPTGSGFSIEISSVANPAITDTSNGTFTIAAP